MSTIKGIKTVAEFKRKFPNAEIEERMPRKRRKVKEMVSPRVFSTGMPYEGWLTVFVPVQTVSEANRRDHWAKKARRTKSQRLALFSLLGAKHAILTPFVTALHADSRLKVTLARLGERHLDVDNLAGSFKAIQDAVAAALLTDDGNPLIAWNYEQDPNEPKIGTMIIIEIDQ